MFGVVEFEFRFGCIGKVWCDNGCACYLEGCKPRLRPGVSTVGLSLTSLARAADIFGQARDKVICKGSPPNKCGHLSLRLATTLVANLCSISASMHLGFTPFCLVFLFSPFKYAMQFEEHLYMSLLFNFRIVTQQVSTEWLGYCMCTILRRWSPKDYAGIIIQISVEFLIGLGLIMKKLTIRYAYTLPRERFNIAIRGRKL